MLVYEKNELRHNCSVNSERSSIMEKKFYTVEDVMTLLVIGKTQAYEIISMLNGELKTKGFYTIRGRVNRSYFDKKFGIEEMHVW